MERREGAIARARAAGVGRAGVAHRRRELEGWREPNKGWTVSGGVLSSVGAADNLVSTQTFGDFKVHVEFRLPKGSNSGVYLRGRYEVQIEDSDAAEPPLDHMGGIYGFLAPRGIRGLSRASGRPSTSRWSAASSVSR